MASLGIHTTGTVTSQAITRDKIIMGRVTIPTMTVKCAKVETTNVKTSSVKNSPEKFDRWIKESVPEIVKNLQEAPLFVHVYDGAETRLKAEKAVAEEWAQLKEKWVKGEEPSPEGIILVEELKGGEIGIYEENEGYNGECTKAWGVLIQGRGGNDNDNGGVGCYLLKTCRVGCGHLGLVSTHFSLVKVNGFKDSVSSQLTTCWLAN